MIVDCPSCQTKFNLPDDKIGDNGANVRCGVCKHVFHVDPPAADDFPGFGESGAKPVWPVSDDESDQVFPPEERLRDRFDDVRTTTKDFADFGLERVEEPKRGRLLKIAAIAALLLALLGGVFGTAAYFFEFWPFSKKVVKSAMEEPIPPAVQQAQQTPPPPAQPALPSMEERLQNVQFSDYQGYRMENVKVGLMFVVEGELVNNNPSPIGQIKVEAALLTDKGQPLAVKEVVAGPKIANHELKILSYQDIETRLTSMQEILFHNGNVKNGEKVPFMVVFDKFPEGTKDYTLRVTSFQDVLPPAAQPQQPQPAGK